MSSRRAKSILQQDAALANNISTILADRGTKYGKFTDHAEISQKFKELAKSLPGWKRLTRHMKESLEMQWHKQARILNGDPRYKDSWKDISGYAELVAETLDD